MKKSLSIVSSTMVAAALLTAVPASAQLAKKAQGAPTGAKASIEMKAQPKRQADKKGFHTASKRTASLPNMLHKVVKHAGSMKGKRSLAPLKAVTGLPELTGMMTYSDNEDAVLGLYKITGEGALDPVIMGPNGWGGVPVGDLYWVSNYVNYGFFAYIEIAAYDLESGEEVASFSPQTFDNIVLDFASNPSTGVIYSLGYNANGDGLQLGTAEFDEETGMTINFIGDLPGNWNSIACAADGTLYGIRYYGESVGDSFVVTSSELCKLDTATAAATTIGETGETPQYLSSATIDPKSGKMYWTVCTDLGYLCEVDLTTGAATKLVDIEGNAEIQGLYVASPAAEDGAPGAATGLAGNFVGGSLSGTISFTAPTTTYDGNAASGALNYAVLANGEEVANGTTQFGAEVTANVTVETAGNYTFTVVTSNSVGQSPVAKLKLFVGNGIPAAPADVELEYVNGQMNLTWEAVTVSADGGYLNPSDVTYTVTRFPGDVVVYEGSATSFSEAIAVPETMERYYYTVVAHFEGLDSAEGTSNMVVLGDIVPPYSNDFATEDSLQDWTIIDANGDGREWQWVSGEVRMRYNGSEEMDDWLITPPIKLEAGKLYTVSFDARANGSSYPERVEAKWGTAPTAAAMTNDLVAPTVLNSSTPMNVGNMICPAADGFYYFGIHGISDADMYYLFVDNFSIGAPTAGTVPAGVTDLTIVPNADGELEATVSFNAPALDMTGGALTSLTEIVVSRDGEAVKTFTNPAVGAALSFVDTPDATGTYTYSVIASNADGQGPEVSANVFIGIDRPAAPANIQIVENATPGNVTVTWDVVNTSYDGNPLNPSKVTYDVCEYNGQGWVPFVEGLTEPTYTYQAVPDGEQDFVQVAVFAITEGGETGRASDLVAVGVPYNGMEESFADGELHYIWGVGYTDGGEWGIYTDDQFSDISSCDGDNGFAGMRGQYIDNTSALFSGKISLAGMTNPGVSFYTYNIIGENPDINEIQLYVMEEGAEDWVELGAPIVVSEIAPDVEGWVQATASLAAYAGKTIQVRFQVIVKQYAYTMLDQIKVGSLLGNDLTISKISAPKTVQNGSSYTVDVTVANRGTRAASTFTVSLFADGVQVAYQTVSGLAASAATTVSFDRSMGDVATESVEYYAVVSYVLDENVENNTSEVITVTPKAGNLPAVTDLTGTLQSDGVLLTWTEPDLTAGPAVAEEVDFEGAESWAQEYEGWTFVDVDESPVGGFQGTDLPGIEPGATTASFFIFDASGDGFNQTFAGHSGDKYLAALFRYDDGTTDDWAISPLLDGSAQTITFWAKSYSTQYPEAIEMYYSTETTAIADFVQVGSKIASVPGDWTEYSFEVPAGAKHFAIRSCATSSFMLMMDDFTFAAAGGVSADLSIVGYNVYRDGVKLNASPVEECEYLDGGVLLGNNEYVVVTVYTTGISGLSNVFILNPVGVEGVLGEGITVAGGKGNITVAGAEGLDLVITAADGKVIYNAEAANRENVAAPAGVYVVKVAKTAVKVVVK